MLYGPKESLDDPPSASSDDSAMNVVDELWAICQEQVIKPLIFFLNIEITWIFILDDTA